MLKHSHHTSGNRRDHEMIDCLYVKLTSASVDAAKEARKQVASAWSTSSMGPAIRVRRRRFFFKRAARAAKGVKKSAAVKKKTQPINLPSAKVLKAKKKLIDPVWQNFSRSEKGTQLIEQEMKALLELDKIAFPNKPVFSVEDNSCRLQYLDQYF